MSVSLDVDGGRFVARLDAIGPDTRHALVASLGALAQDVAADARSIAAAHIHVFGKKPGQYIGSIYGGVSDKSYQVVGFVRSSSSLAHLLEYGATIPPHEILPDAAKVLAFLEDSSTVFAKAVHSPGAKVPPYPAIDPAFDAARGRIEDAIDDAVSGATR